MKSASEADRYMPPSLKSVVTWRNLHVGQLLSHFHRPSALKGPLPPSSRRRLPYSFIVRNWSPLASRYFLLSIPAPSSVLDFKKQAELLLLHTRTTHSRTTHSRIILSRKSHNDKHLGPPVHHCSAGAAHSHPQCKSILAQLLAMLGTHTNSFTDESDVEAGHNGEPLFSEIKTEKITWVRRELPGVLTEYRRPYTTFTGLGGDPSYKFKFGFDRGKQILANGTKMVSFSCYFPRNATMTDPCTAFGHRHHERRQASPHALWPPSCRQTVRRLVCWLFGGHQD